MHTWSHAQSPGYCGVSPVAQLVKNPPAMQETWVLSLGWEDPLEKGKVVWPGEFHGLYSPQDRKQLDPTEQLSLSQVRILGTIPCAIQ